MESAAAFKEQVATSMGTREDSEQGTTLAERLLRSATKPRLPGTRQESR